MEEKEKKCPILNLPAAINLDCLALWRLGGGAN
jgi:hypothetical protein